MLLSNSNSQTEQGESLIEFFDLLARYDFEDNINCQTFLCDSEVVKKGSSIAEGESFLVPLETSRTTNI